LADRIVPLPVQLPGRESRYDEALITDATTLADAFIAAAASLLRQQPYALFGHSMGALVAYEVARRARAQGLPPARHLFASGGRAPVLPDRQPPVRDLPEPELIETMRRWNGVPEAVLRHPELLAIVLPVLRADLTLCETYARHPVERLAIPVTAFGGRTDPRVAVAEIEEWEAMTTAGSTTRFYDAGHFFLESHLADVQAVVGARLAAAATQTMPGARS
jgi:medium-chain acyl-[acyl-carrier-protein] hydrolase